jgi:hypothetical protein
VGDLGGWAYDLLVFGKSGVFSKEISMGRDARNEDVTLSPTTKTSFDLLVKELAIERFGVEPALETPFAEIEQFGHRVGRMLARAVDKEVTTNHASHFREEQACPKCGRLHPPGDGLHELPLVTQDGEVTLEERAFRCSPCGRDFFPSTGAAEN